MDNFSESENSFKNSQSFGYKVRKLKKEDSNIADKVNNIFINDNNLNKAINKKIIKYSNTEENISIKTSKYGDLSKDINSSRNNTFKKYNQTNSKQNFKLKENQKIHKLEQPKNIKVKKYKLMKNTKIQKNIRIQLPVKKISPLANFIENSHSNGIKRRYQSERNIDEIYKSISTKNYDNYNSEINEKYDKIFYIDGPRDVVIRLTVPKKEEKRDQNGIDDVNEHNEDGYENFRRYNKLSSKYIKLPKIEVKNHVNKVDNNKVFYTRSYYDKIKKENEKYLKVFKKQHLNKFYDQVRFANLSIDNFKNEIDSILQGAREKFCTDIDKEKNEKEIKYNYLLNS